jgi:hypothetical protein
MLPKDEFPGFGEDDATLDESEAESLDLQEGLRTLGYMD